MNIEFPSPAEIEARRLANRIKKSGALPSSIESAPIEEEDDADTLREHHLTPKVVSLLTQRLNLWLVGPAGSGKSYVAEEAAKILNLPFHCPPIGRETTNAQLFGYFNASGQYVRTPIRQAVEFGGVLHLEEIDFASPAVGTALNALLANRTIGFPDTSIPRHPDFVIIASANTFGIGANASYIGSQGLNAATLDRFIFLPFPYDEKLERKIARNKQWTLHVQSMRKKAALLNVKHVISPRASIQGSLLINSKEFTWEQVETMVLFRGLDSITIEKIRNAPAF
jgi:MoxR-like ATPase